jgi:hypothetical protein
VIFLGKFISRVHDPVRDIAIIREKQQSFGFTIQPANRIDTLPGLDEVHDFPAIALVFNRRDVPTWFVEKDVPWLLGLEMFSVNSDIGMDRIGFRAECCDHLSIDRYPSSGDHFLGLAPRSNSSRRENALQAFHVLLQSGQALEAEGSHRAVIQGRFNKVVEG